ASGVPLSARGRCGGRRAPSRTAPRRRRGALPIPFGPMIRVAILAGGRSPEREVSLRSGHRVAGALAARGHDARLIDPADLPLIEALEEGRFDVCFIALHGRDGEDGTVQRLLELMGVPYTGTGPFACQVAFDKVLAKEALRAAGVRTPAWVTIQASALRD